MNLFEYIKANQNVIDCGYKLGAVNSGVMNQYRLTCKYLKLDKKLGKMTRYQWIADENNVSITTVRDSVKKMGVD